MLLKPYVYPYKMGSRSATILAENLETKKVYPNRRYRNSSDHLVVNWGSTVAPSWLTSNTRMLNSPQAVSVASDKLRAFETLSDAGVHIPVFTTSKAEASGWLTGRATGGEEKRRILGVLDALGNSIDPALAEGEGNYDGIWNSLVELVRRVEWYYDNPTTTTSGGIVYCRTLPRGSGGRGIVIARIPEEVVPAPLYTKGIDIKREYRVHVFQREVIDLVAKVLPSDVEATPIIQMIRNHTNGWVFARDAVVIPEDVRSSLGDIAKRAVSALSLDFGAVDIVRSTSDELFVLEVNTAPGIEGTTLDKYTEAIKRVCL